MRYSELFGLEINFFLFIILKINFIFSKNSSIYEKTLNELMKIIRS